MRIHTTLTVDDLYRARRASGAPIHFEKLTEHRSTSHARAFEVRLSGTGGRNNTGLYGAGDYDGATWDEWGAFFGALYELDQTARCGGTAARPGYANGRDFHRQTGHRFTRRALDERKPCDCGVKYGGKPADGAEHFPGCSAPVIGTHLPADTHPRHRWVYDRDNHVTRCAHKAGCTATMPR